MNDTYKIYITSPKEVEKLFNVVQHWNYVIVNLNSGDFKLHKVYIGYIYNYDPDLISKLEQIKCLRLKITKTNNFPYQCTSGNYYEYMYGAPKFNILPEILEEARNMGARTLTYTHTTGESNKLIVFRSYKDFAEIKDTCTKFTNFLDNLSIEKSFIYIGRVMNGLHYMPTRYRNYVIYDSNVLLEKNWKD